MDMSRLIEPLSKSLLWVDDDGPGRFRYEETLLRREGWTVIWATTTDSAAKILAKTGVDGVIADMMFPLANGDNPSIWSGFGLIKWLRGDWEGDWGDMQQAPAVLERYKPLEDNKDVPIVVVSAFFDAGIEERLLKLPQSDELSWLPKPVNSAGLTAFIETLELSRGRRRGGIPINSLVLTIEEIEPAWDAVRKYLARNPNYLHQMHPRKFELLVAEIFRDFGWQVELTSRTRDGGYDIIAVRREWPSQLRLLIEAKRFIPSRKVGVGIVRSLYGVKSTVAASQAILATSSFVTKDVRREFAHVIPWELDFLERDKILEWCAQADPALLKKDLVFEG